MKNEQNVQTEFCERRAIAKIGREYQRFDGDYAKVSCLPNNNNISPDGLSLLDDIEFFLAQPGFGKGIEEELFKIIQALSLRYLRAQRGQVE